MQCTQSLHSLNGNITAETAEKYSVQSESGIHVASFLGLLTPAFFACSTSAREFRPGKRWTSSGRLEEWHISG